MTYMDRVHEIVDEDVQCLRKKDAEYGGSWLRRGGAGAFFITARKWDRLETQVEKQGYDILIAAAADCREEGILDDIRDLRRYLILIEAEILERSVSKIPRCVPRAVNPTGMNNPFGFSSDDIGKN